MGFEPWQKYLAEVDRFAISFAQESDSRGIGVMKIGYARVSTEDQHVDLQLDALMQAGCRRLFCDKVSGVGRHRPELLRMLEQLREGDTVVVWKLDRLARSTRELLATVETIREAGATFRSLSEPWADTTSHGGKFILTVFAQTSPKFSLRIWLHKPTVSDHRNSVKLQALSFSYKKPHPPLCGLGGASNRPR
jgi:hypothetical protein